MKFFRSLLFVPGNRPDLVEKAHNSGADALILDLEDSVPIQKKIESRMLVREVLENFGKSIGPIFVRVNGFETGMTFKDIDAILCEGLYGIVIPKVEAPKDLQIIDEYLKIGERENCLDLNSIETPLVLETAPAMHQSFQIAVSSQRIKNIILAAGPGGDAARAIGYQWSKTGIETLFLRSKIVLESRAAKLQPVAVSWWDIKDLEGLKKDAQFNRQIGFSGMAIIHPSHVPIVNEAFTPTKEEIKNAIELIEVMKNAEKSGAGVVQYKGEMVDYAMIKTAEELIEFAYSIGLSDNILMEENKGVS